MTSSSDPRGPRGPREPRGPGLPEPGLRSAGLRGEISPERAAEQGRMFANRIAKTFRKLAGRMEKASIGAYRLFDRDIPEIRAVADWYEGHLVVAEYERRQTEAVGDWLGVVGRAAAEALGVPEERLHLKQRRTRQADGGPRYRRLSRRERLLEVREGALRFLVNLDDYTDTGLFLDQRLTRRLVREQSAGRRMLNLFAYTGAFTCAAAGGDASETLSVDQSGIYLDWLRENLGLNGLEEARHQTLRADPVAFLEDAIRDGLTWDLIVLDPPSFSTLGDGRMLDIQRDHRKLVLACLAVLSPGGVLWFSTNHQRFEPNLDGLPVASLRDMTAQTIPEDFRNQAVHRCWRIVGRDATS